MIQLTREEFNREYLEQWEPLDTPFDADIQFWFWDVEREQYVVADDVEPDEWDWLNGRKAQGY